MFQAALTFVKSQGFTIEDELKWTSLKDINDILNETIFAEVIDDVMLEMAKQCGLIVTSENSIDCLKVIKEDCDGKDILKVEELIELLKLQNGSCIPNFMKCMTIISSIEDARLTFAMEFFTSSLMECIGDDSEGDLITDDQYGEGIRIVNHIMERGMDGLIG